MRSFSRVLQLFVNTRRFKVDKWGETSTFSRLEIHRATFLSSSLGLPASFLFNLTGRKERFCSVLTKEQNSCQGQEKFCGTNSLSSYFTRHFRSLFFLGEITCAIQVIRNMHLPPSQAVHSGEAYNLHFLPSHKSAVTSGPQKVISAVSAFNGIVELTDEMLLI